MLDPKSVTVTIYGHEYTLRGEADSGYVEKVADFVDRKMCEVAENSAVASTATCGPSLDKLGEPSYGPWLTPPVADWRVWHSACGAADVRRAVRYHDRTVGPLQHSSRDVVMEPRC